MIAFWRPTPPAPLTVSALFERYKAHFECYRSYRHYRYLIAKVKREFGEENAQALRPGQIDEYVSRRLASVKPSTVGSELGCLSTLYECAIRDEVITRNPVRSAGKLPHLNNVRIRYLLDHEEPILQEHSRKKLWRWIQIAYLSCMRMGEQFRLHRENLNFETGIIELLNTKNGGGRYVPMSLRLAELFQEELAGHDSPWVFPSPQRKDMHVCTTTVSKHLKAAVVSAGIPPLTWHCLRHTGATRLLRSGADVRTVQDVLGHATVEMTMRYCKVCPMRAKDAMESLSRWNERPDANP